MNDPAVVTFGVPVYRGERFLRRTLASIQNQSCRDFQAIVSFDGPDPACEKICRPFLRDRRFRLVVQPDRLGWVAHLNLLMSQVRTPYWCYQQQDDILAKNYLRVLLRHAEQAPEAAVVYCDIVSFGTREGTVSQASVTGRPVARQLALLQDHHPAAAFRGLTRIQAIRKSGGIPRNDVEHFSCDTAWMAAVARWGELQRVPAALYRKRYHDENVHAKWASWPLERRRQAWVVHCVDMLEQALQVEATPQERRLLWSAAVARLTGNRHARPYIEPQSLSADERRGMLEGFLALAFARPTIDLPALLDADRETIARTTRQFFWIPQGPGSAAEAQEAASEFGIDRVSETS